MVAGESDENGGRSARTEHAGRRLPSVQQSLMPKTLATATVDRLLHHAHIVITEGTSLRLAEATAGKGVIPLT
jgi:hypothetical protein